MAVKRYFTNDTSPITFPSVTGWNVTGSSAGNALAAAAAGAGAASQGAETSATNPTDVLCRRFASDQMLSAGDLEGAWQAVIAGNETDAAADGFPRLVIRVVSSDGSTSRGSQAFVDSTEWTTTNTGRTVSGTISPAIACQLGDRIIVEVGWRATNTVTTSYQVNIRRGGTDGTDMAPGDTGANANARPSYITFTDATANARFAPPALGVTPTTAAATGAANTPTVTTDVDDDVDVTAGPAAASGTANQPGRAVTVRPAAALATGTASTPARAGSTRPAAAAAAGAASGPGRSGTVQPGATAAAGAAHQPVVSTEAAGQVTPASAAATGAAWSPARAVTVTPRTATATGRTASPAPAIAAVVAAIAVAQAFAPVRALQVSPPGPVGSGHAHAPVFTGPDELTVTPTPAQATGRARRPAVSAVEPPAAGQPGWGSLQAILAAGFASPEPPECPLCGTRFQDGPSGRPFCPFDGHQPAGSGPPPTESVSRSWGGLTSASTTYTTSSSNDQWEGWGP